MADAAYHVGSYKMLSSEHGLPQARARIYIVGLQKGPKFGYERNSGALQAISELLGMFKRPPVPWTALVEKPEDLYVTSELARCLEVGRGLVSRCISRLKCKGPGPAYVSYDSEMRFR